MATGFLSPVHVALLLVVVLMLFGAEGHRNRVER
jgi:Sec-independent protein translocase protein TatA